MLDCSLVDELSRNDHRSLPPLERLGIALSDPTRQAILLRLADGPAFPSELAAMTRTSPSNLSNHLSCLRGCGLVVSERQGRHIRYELVTTRLGAALAAVADAVDAATPVSVHGR